MNQFVIYSWLLISIWLTIAIYRMFLHLISIDKLLWMAFQGIFIFLVWMILYFIFWNKWFNFSNLDTKSIIWIILAGTVLTLNWFLIMTWLRMWYNLSTFTPAYAILWNVFIVIIWFLFFKENINIYNIFWLILWMVGIYFLAK